MYKSFSKSFTAIPFLVNLISRTVFVNLNSLSLTSCNSTFFAGILVGVITNSGNSGTCDNPVLVINVLLVSFKWDTCLTGTSISALIVFCESIVFACINDSFFCENNCN